MVSRCNPPRQVQGRAADFLQVAASDKNYGRVSGDMPLFKFVADFKSMDVW